MAITAVIGLQWGDEGKGKIVDALGGRADMVARCQGGSNAGHTIVMGGRKFVLHLVPSGMLREGITCFIGNGVVVDLEVLDREIKDLEQAGIRTSGRLMVSRRAHVVLPFHKHIEEADEASRGDKRIGTTMRGIGPCYSDKYARVGFRVGDLLNVATLEARIEAARRTYGAPSGARPAFDADETMAYCRTFRPMVREVSGDVTSTLLRGAREGKRILLEGAQGFLLDIDHGTYPYVTSSNTGIHGLLTGSGLPPSSITGIVGVLKAYVTRVGEGPLPTEMEEPYQTWVRERGREFGSTTGRPRRCGWLDLVALEYACRLNAVTGLVVTKLDTLSGLEALKVCTAYRHSDRPVEGFPSDVGLLADCVPQYQSAATWETLDGATTMESLPGGARSYLETIAGALECPVQMVSVGPARDDIIQVAG
jgi:adenylosuccinate synthase